MADVLEVSTVDPVTLIVTALVAGAAAGGKDAAQDVVTSAYAKLRTALAGKAGDPTAGRTLERHADDPTGYDVPVRDLVVDSGAAGDATILDLAKQLLSAADPSGSQVGKYNVQVNDSKGIVIGDNANVTQTFN